MAQTPISRIPELSGYSFRLYAEGAEGRSKVEETLKDCYRKAFSAELTQFMPNLLVLEKNNTVCAVVGLRSGSSEAMLLEHYIDKPVHTRVGEYLNQEIAREDVIEIGSLVSVEKGACLILFVLLTCLLNRAGYRFMAFTATAKLQKMVRRFGVKPMLLADATEAAVADGDWGTYYETNPQVLVSDIGEMMTIRDNNPVIGTLIDNHEGMLRNTVATLPLSMPETAHAA